MEVTEHHCTYDPLLSIPTMGFFSQDIAVNEKIIPADKTITMTPNPTMLLPLGFALAITRPETITIKPIRIGFKMSEIKSRF